jgi:Gas vesicle synthesis protein GvpL/GvpF
VRKRGSALVNAQREPQAEGLAAPKGEARRQRVWVYAVVSGASGPLRCEGASGERLRRVRVAGLDLVIGAVPRVPRPTASALRRYDAAVRRLMDTHGSVLPARYGTNAATLDELTAATVDRREALRRALRLVRHRVQMTVRVFNPGSVQSQFRANSGSVQNQFRVEPERNNDGAARGRQYLQRRAADLQIPESEPLRAAVRKWVRAERTERHHRGRLAGSMYHLVPRGAAPAYRAALQRAAVAADLTVVISGPWPPYAFAEGGW